MVLSFALVFGAVVVLLQLLMLSPLPYESPEPTNLQIRLVVVLLSLLVFVLVFEMVVIV